MQAGEIFVGGNWQAPVSGETYHPINPANEEPLAAVAQGRRARHRPRGDRGAQGLRRGAVAADEPARARAYRLAARAS